MWSLLIDYASHAERKRLILKYSFNTGTQTDGEKNFFNCKWVDVIEIAQKKLTVERPLN